jgi:uncharacterized protein YjlB
MLGRRSLVKTFALGLAGVATASAPRAASALMTPMSEVIPESFILQPNGWAPNNPHLPVLLYKGVIKIAGDDPPSLFEVIFRRNGWPPQWRNGVYDFHHYHPTAHEALGFAGGRARLLLGGPNGREMAVETGDVAVLPTSVSQCRIKASDGFLVVGAYPPYQHWDICREPPTPQASERMEHLPSPAADPVSGAGGALDRLWTPA